MDLIGNQWECKHVVRWYYHVNLCVKTVNGDIFADATVGNFVTEGVAVAV